MSAHQVPTGAGAREYAELMDRQRAEIAKHNAPSLGDQYLRSKGFRRASDPSPRELLEMEWRNEFERMKRYGR